MERPPTRLSALSDRELEILRLLTAGHTVKTIAARLGRSEASINERLRDARRKTGVGSSRELARMLAVQKIWDRNFDLPPSGSPTHATAQPRERGRSWSKGSLVMLAALSLAAAAGITLTLAGSPPQAATSAPMTAVPGWPLPLVGSWSLDVDRVPADERPQRVTMAFEVSTDQKWTTRIEIVDPDGALQRGESTAAFDGVPVPVTGNMGFIDSVSLRQPAPNTLVMTLASNGAPVSTRIYTVAKDHQSMTETIVWAGNSVPKLETNHFKRIG